MKKNISRIIALILTIASLVSMLTVFAFAADEQVEGEVGTEPSAPPFDPTEQLLINRTFEDGWDAFNGLPASGKNIGSHILEIDYEESDDYSYNYFMRFEYGPSSTNGYVTYNFGNRVVKEGYTIIGLSVKADDACELGTILYAKTGGSENVDLLVIRNSSLYAFNTSADNYLGSLADNDWYDVEIIINWNDMSKFDATVLVDGVETASIKRDWSLNTADAGIKDLYLGFAGASSYESKVGLGYCVDNLRIYQGQPKPIDLSSYGYGIFVDTAQEKTVTILESSAQMTPERALAESLAMKLGVSSALSRNEKIDISDYFIPTENDGNVIISLELILEYLGYPYYVHSNGASYDITISTDANTYLTVGRDTATVAGKLVDLDFAPAAVENANGEKVVVISITDVEKLFPGWLVAYDDMGLIIVYKNFAAEGEDASNLINRRDNLDTMLDMMKKFVFDVALVDANGADLSDEQSYAITGADIASAVTTEKQHPYIYVDGATFESLKATLAGEDSVLKGYIVDAVAKADSYYAEAVASVDASGTVTFKDGMKPVNVYQDNVWPSTEDPEAIPDSDDGYNPNNLALYELEAYTEKLVDLAFAYQVTGDDKYVQLAYAVSLALGEWNHWAPGYFINCATAANNFAVAYDWLYNAYVELYGEQAVEALAEILYTKALTHGYNSVTGAFCKFPRTAGYGDQFINRADYWNAIGTAGMVIGTMAIMDSQVYAANKTQLDYLVGASLVNLTNYGLDRYAPDGSYIDSVTYWAQGTNAFMKLIMALNSAAGDDYGFKDTWGINTTFYYACYIENSDGKAWNYHEDGVGSIVNADAAFVADTQMFNFAAALLGDADLAAIRQNQIAKGKQVTIFDILFYPTEPIGEPPVLELDYLMDGLDAFVSRDSWENGALYVGLMGGQNNYTAYGDGEGDEIFGQLDSGNFIYTNKGIEWIVDLGSDNFYAYSYFGGYRYRYYRNGAEGHNVVIVTSAQANLAYGQDENGNGDMYETYVDPNGKGSYAVIDNVTAYGKYANAAIRGMLVINDRKTVVIQDEIAFQSPDGVANAAQNVSWIAHTTVGEILIADGDASTAYLIEEDAEGNEVIIRATIVSNAEYSFSVMESDETNLLKQTLAQDSSQLARPSGLKRLVINAENKLNFQLSVVFEVVEATNSGEPLGYEWTSIGQWASLFEDKQDTDSDVEIRGVAVRRDITEKTSLASIYLDDETAFSGDFEDFYIALATVGYTLLSHKPEEFGATEHDLKNAYDDWNDYVELYNEYRKYINDSTDEILDLASRLAGK